MENDLREELGLDEEALFMDGYDDCILGVCEQFGRPSVVAYDRDKVLAKLRADGMDEQEAQEFFDFNQLGAWMGDFTPVFIRRV